MLIFGTPWDAPVCDDATVLPEVPVYADCLPCGERFREGDSGIVMPYVGDGLDARYVVGIAGEAGWLVGAHRECHLAGIVGHMVGVCACTGWDITARATGLEVQRRADGGALDRLGQA